MPPTDAETEVLNVYSGVVSVGVGTMKLGSVVATVADIDEKRDDTESAVSVIFVLLTSGYSPIRGGSLWLIPKLIGISSMFC